ncbi:hypothetical protein JAAARDRAFT_75861 [Jaapia argillacea MUCL 33604]|uniref:Uncharacterized protein n=1 Tax=Jaapia argillacea MUCL 33604 TaxID=933084 RepID=A0A067QLM0_9AGAM|nr:hypothetical protein JAAARDRAFT_75861 [Jaapia argillacea MUCL 33604]
MCKTASSWLKPEAGIARDRVPIIDQSLNLTSSWDSTLRSLTPTIVHIHRGLELKDNEPGEHITFPAHGDSIVTCLLISHDLLISASDDNSINVYSLRTGSRIHSLYGHEGGVWALAVIGNTLVSGSADRNVRVWDLNNGTCTHVLGGHTSTIRCLTIVEPEWFDLVDVNGAITKEQWPKEPLIVTGSRDWSVRVWGLPRPGDQEYRGRGCGTDLLDGESTDKGAGISSYHQFALEGHDHVVRALAAQGRTIVSASYDCTARVWDIATRNCTWILIGHTGKVYNVALDTNRNHAYTSSMDDTVRIWNLQTGQCHHLLTGHTSLVGLLRLSPSHLVSAAADTTLRVWDPTNGRLQHTLVGHTGAVTCFHHDDYKVASGSEGSVKLWDIRSGRVLKNLLGGGECLPWQVVFKGRWCAVAHSTKKGTMIDIWDFGEDRRWERGESSDDEEYGH